MPHTPGPWHRNTPPASKYTVIFAGRNTHVARIIPDGHDQETCEANANLIAAAPRMLAALELAEAALRHANPESSALPAIAETIRMATVGR